MAVIIEVADLPSSIQSHELVSTMVAGANAKASRVAPCLTWADEDVDHPAPSDDQLAEAKLVLIGMVKRWVDTGAGALQSQQAGPFGMSIDTRQRGGFNPWPSEIEALQDICKDDDADSRAAFAIDTAPTAGLAGHSPYCDLFFGGESCSCGYALTGVSAIYEPF